MFGNVDKQYAKMIAGHLTAKAEKNEKLKAAIVSETTKKTLKTCLDYVKGEARKQAEDGVAVIEDSVVYGWAVHYYLDEPEPQEEKNTLPTLDEAKKKVEENQAVEHVEMASPVKVSSKAKKPVKSAQKALYEQLSLFD